MISIKLKLDKLKKENINYSKLDNAIETVNKLIHLNYLFMRSFLIDSFNKNEKNIIINKKFIGLGFKIIINSSSSDKIKGRKIGSENNNTFDKMMQFWKVFSKIIKIDNLKCSNISYILSQAADEIYTNIINNLLLNFDKYIVKCIKSHYCMDNEKPNNIFKPLIRELIKHIIDKKINASCRVI